MLCHAHPMNTLGPDSPLASTHIPTGDLIMTTGPHTHDDDNLASSYYTHNTTSNSDTPTVTTSNGETASINLIMPLSVSGAIVLVVLLFIIVAALSCFFVHRQSKNRKRKESLLLIQQPQNNKAAATTHGFYSETDNPLKQTAGMALNSSSSTCALRKSRVSLSSLVSTKFKGQEYENLCDREDESEDIADLKSNPKVSVISEADSGCYDSGTEPTPTPLLVSHDNHMAAMTGPGSFHTRHDTEADNQQYFPTQQFCRPKTSSSHVDTRVQSAKADNDEDTPEYDGDNNTNIEHHTPLFPNWKPTMGETQLSPGLQRPMTMGGVYSTRHHHHYHNRNCSHGNIHRGSVTSSYGTGTSTRTSARTSRSTSRQFGSGSVRCGSSSMGRGSAVFGPGVQVAEESKMPLQS